MKLLAQLLTLQENNESKNDNFACPRKVLQTINPDHNVLQLHTKIVCLFVAVNPSKFKLRLQWGFFTHWLAIFVNLTLRASKEKVYMLESPSQNNFLDQPLRYRKADCNWLCLGIELGPLGYNYCSNCPKRWLCFPDPSVTTKSYTVCTTTCNSLNKM